ncbi:hypothetical protein Dimus_014016 [Dionaea muscipula]
MQGGKQESEIEETVKPEEMKKVVEKKDQIGDLKEKDNEEEEKVEEEEEELENENVEEWEVENQQVEEEEQEEEKEEDVEKEDKLNEAEQRNSLPSCDIKLSELMELDKVIAVQSPTICNEVHAVDASDDSSKSLDEKNSLPNNNNVGHDCEEIDAVKDSGTCEDEKEMHANILLPESNEDDDHMEVDEKHPVNEEESVGLDAQLLHDSRSNGSDLLKSEGNTVHGSVSVSRLGSDAHVSGSVFEVGDVKKELINEMGMRELSMDVSHSRFVFEADTLDGGESGTEEEQTAFVKELENFFKEKSMEFKPPKFYGEPLNLLKLWRAVIKLGGYEKVTSCKYWRQVGESFNPPKTCTTVSWTFRIFYEKALLDYERHKTRTGELGIAVSLSEPANIENQVGNNQASGSGRARRDAAARAMQGWHSQRLLGNGEVSDPIIKDKSSTPLQKREKQQKNIGALKRKRPSILETVHATPTKLTKPQLDTAVVDIGQPADWVKINVRVTKDCYEVYALVPGLLREEVRVQSDPVGRLVITGEPENPENPWGVTPFKKVVSLPSRIDPHQTSAVVTLHGQLFVRVPFEQSD